MFYCCRRCKEKKTADNFPKTTKGKPKKLCSSCKAIPPKDRAAEDKKNYELRYPNRVAAAKAEYAEKNKDLIRSRLREDYKNNPDKYLLPHKTWREENPDKAKEISDKWARNNKAVSRAKVRAYQARKIKATPPWADKKEMENIYKIAEALTLASGVKHCVDHIIPLRGKNVCGLHCQENLQVLQKRENLYKSNKFVDEGYFSI